MALGPEMHVSLVSSFHVCRQTWQECQGQSEASGRFIAIVFAGIEPRQAEASFVHNRIVLSNRMAIFAVVGHSALS